MEESDKENLYKNVFSLDGIYAYNEAEKLVPKEKSLTDLILFGLRLQKILPTIAVLYGCFFAQFRAFRNDYFLLYYTDLRNLSASG